MAFTLFPVPALSTLSTNGFQVPLANTQYQVSGTTFDAGTYKITTFPTTSQATITFGTSAGVQLITTTIDGTVTVNLGVNATYSTIYINTGTNIIVSIERTADILTGVSISGTLDTITTSGTYNQTGKLFVVAIAGGEGGGSGGANGAGGWTSDEYGGGNGGTSGAWATYLGYSNTAQTITIGTGGNGQAALTGSPTGITRGNAGGTTSFGSLAVANNANVNLNKGLGGNGGNGGDTSASVTLFKNIGNITTGGGGSGAQSGSSGSDNTQSAYGARGAGTGLGSGIGTGGNGAPNFNVAANAATGRAAGGGGGYGRTSRYNGSAGAAGTGGVVYVLRGF